MSGIEVEKVERRTTTSFLLHVSGAPDLDKRWTRGRRRIRPATVSFEDRDGVLGSVTVSGPVLLKDGQPSEKLTESVWYASVLTDAEAPEWLQVLVVETTRFAQLQPPADVYRRAWLAHVAFEAHMGAEDGIWPTEGSCMPCRRAAAARLRGEPDPPDGCGVWVEYRAAVAAAKAHEGAGSR